jgi:hypothetical protein
MPMYLVESNYEGQQNGGTDGCVTIRNCRLQEWWTMTSGATGQMYGGPCYGMTNSTTLSSCDTTGVTQLGYLTTLMNSINWWQLAPDTTNTLVTSPLYNSTNCPTTGSIVSVRCVTDSWDSTNKNLGVVYDPTGVSVTVALSQMASGENTTARWYDPTDGAYTAVTGSPFADTGSQTFTTPGANSAGDADWVLLLQANPARKPALSASPGSKDFSSQRVGTVSAAQTFTITDTGTATLDISTVTLAGSDAGQYARSNDHCSGQAIAPNGTCTVQVAFAPTSTGTHNNASLQITSDAPTSPTNVALSGTGITPANWLLAHSRVTHLKLRSNGLATLDVTVPVPGIVNVMESIWKRNEQFPPVGAGAPALLHSLRAGLVLAHAHRVVRRSGTFKITLPAKVSIKRLIAQERHPIRIRVWVTFTPRDGPRLLIGVSKAIIAR